MKKSLLICLSAIFILNSTTVFAASKNNYIATVEIKAGSNDIIFEEDGKKEITSYEGEPLFVDENDRLQIPLRYTKEILCEKNINVNWKEKDKSAYIFFNDYEKLPIASVSIGSNVLKSSIGYIEFKIDMDCEPTVKNDRVFIPLRYLLNAMGIEDKNILWNNDTQTIKIIKTKYNYSSKELETAWNTLLNEKEKYDIAGGSIDIFKNRLSISVNGLNKEKENAICEYVGMTGIHFVNEDDSVSIND